MVVALVLTTSSVRPWTADWLPWQRRLWGASLTVIVSQGIVAGLFAFASLLESSFDPAGGEKPANLVYRRLGVPLTIILIAAWLGVWLQDVTGFSAKRLPFLVTGLTCLWWAWDPPRWAVYWAVNPLAMVVGARGMRLVYAILGLATIGVALFASAPNSP